MSTNKMWGGRFEGGPAAAMQDITPSIDFDKRMAMQDLEGSRAHVRMLAKQGIVEKSDCEAILKGLDSRFDSRLATYGPYFFPELDGISEADEQAAIDRGLIQANRIQYAGRRRSHQS